MSEVEVVQSGRETAPQSLRPRRAAEVLVIIALMIVSVIFIPGLKGLIAIASIIYFIVDWKIREGDAPLWGPTIAGLTRDIRRTWLWIILVSVVSQLVFVLVFKYYSPETAMHIKDRLPSSGELNGQLILAILIAPLGEEIAFRGLIQQRIGWFVPPWAAICTSSLLFALMHFSTGSAEVVFWDLLSVFVDSVIFGIIYMRTKNIVVAFMAHLLADVIAMLLLVTMI
ncbi:CPBP family intramembrane glutamic endopeptidase [Cohnella sp. AR92]|uniref:CPBP family intramembrane glutamic endopeptidase n=1 Tax=Cohnella sp. AR92 TaxID=648716 RepID=UPI000F8D18AC|nr:type II CAAX endopeptidase family protein [Cohnella sp. AR92]RUS48864.1 CPBP family intramembrane metalloprotease [Cohnella sp. AR92]